MCADALLQASLPVIPPDIPSALPSFTLLSLLCRASCLQVAVSLETAGCANTAHRADAAAVAALHVSGV